MLSQVTDTGTTSTLSESSPAYIHSDPPFCHHPVQKNALMQTAIAEVAESQAKDWPLEITDHPWLGDVSSNSSSSRSFGI
jgi:hypothetical protein